MQHPLDLRIQKTYKALNESFLQLLKEKRFDHITVSEICSRASVRRATFYKHFGDKYEFFAFVVQSIQKEFDSKTPQTEFEELSSDPYGNIVKNFLNFLDENDALVYSAMESEAYPILLNIISNQLVWDVKKCILEDQKRGKVPVLSPDLMAQAFTGALVNLARWWVVHKEQISKEELIEQLTGLIQSVYTATERNAADTAAAK